MYKNKMLNLTDNSQCQCFQAPWTPFLSKKSMGLFKSTGKFQRGNPKDIEEPLTGSNTKTSLKATKRSGKTAKSPEYPRKSQKDREMQSEKQLKIRDVHSCQRRLFMPTTPETKAVTRINSITYLGNSQPKSQNITKSTIPVYSCNTIGSPRPLQHKSTLTSQVSCPPPRISFNISNPQKTSNPQPIKEKVKPVSPGKIKLEKKPSFALKKKLSLQITMKQSEDTKDKEPTGQDTYKHSQFSSEIYDGRQMVMIESLDLNEEDLKKDKKERYIYQSMPLEHIVDKKSSLKHKQGPKIWKKQPILSRISDVQEIRSLADSEELGDSDKESIVLESLKRQNSLEIQFAIPQLDKGSPENQSISSTIITSRPVPYLRQFIY